MTDKAQRRRFTAAYKLKVLVEAKACRQPGGLGALLRREGLYSSHLAAWRAAPRRGDLTGPASGPPPIGIRPAHDAYRPAGAAVDGRRETGRPRRGHR